MTNTFKTSIVAAVAMFALSGVARAESVTISLTGKDARTIHTEIVKAAYQVCREVGSDSIALSNTPDCVSDTIEKADADARRAVSTPMQKAELSSALRGER